MHLKYLLLRSRITVIIAYIIMCLFFYFLYIEIINYHPKRYFNSSLIKTYQTIKIYKERSSKIDIVYTWVNGSDPEWIKAFNQMKNKLHIKMKAKLFNMRFIDGEELRFSLRSIEKYAIHMVRYIFIVVANNVTQVPYWLNLSHPKIRLITHHTIFRNLVPKGYTSKNSIFNFNSVAIENCLTNIPDLSEKFIYFNDDFFIGQRVEISDFFDSEGRPIVLINEHNYSNVEKENKKYTRRGQNDFSSMKYAASLTYTMLVFKRKYESLYFQDPKHVAYPTTKTLINECKEVFKDEITETIKRSFRNVRDIKMQFITFQYGYYHKKIVAIDPPTDTARFLVLGTKKHEGSLVQLASIKPKLFAINCDNPKYIQKTKALLYCWFSEPSSFEKRNTPNVHIPKFDLQYWKSVLNINDSVRHDVVVDWPPVHENISNLDRLKEMM